jgi:hypothetical protein
MKVYVSSTFEDLKEFRSEVYRQLRKLRIDAVAMEDYVASEKRPLAKCLDDVAAADIYIGVFAWRYGYIPKESGNPDARSITELEYRAAGQSSTERLIFLLRDDAAWKPGLMDTHTGEGDGGKQIEKLREELGTRHAVGFFSTPDELAKEVSAAVTNVLLRQLGEVHAAEKKAPAATDGDAHVSGSVRQGRDGFFLTSHSYRRGLEVSASVGRIDDAEGRGRASGFLVSGTSLHPRLGAELYLMTPAHVVARQKTQGAFNLTVDEATFRLMTMDDAQEVLRLKEIVWFSPVDELDVSVIRLEKQPQGVSGLALAASVPQWTPASSGLAALFSNPEPRVSLVGHPQGGSLAFSLGGVLLASDNLQIQYLAETEPGSGGSPVFNDRWQVIGIHRLHGDIRLLNGQGRVNACEAVSISAVRQALATQLG